VWCRWWWVFLGVWAFVIPPWMALVPWQILMSNGMVMVIMWECRALDIMACLGIRDGFIRPKQQGWLLHLVMGGDDR
jgi:hypothetical protein